MGNDSEKTYKDAFKRFLGFKKRGYAFDVVSRPYRIKYVYDTETKTIIAEAYGNANLPEDKRLDDTAWETLKSLGYQPVDSGNYIKLFEIGAKPVDAAYQDFVDVFSTVFKQPTNRGIAYELSTTEPTPAIQRLLGFALDVAGDVSKQAYKMKHDPLARAGIVTANPNPKKSGSCLVLIAAFAGIAIVMLETARRVISAL